MELQSATLALTMLLATGLTIRAFTPPNPNPKAVPLNAGAGVDNMRVFTGGVFLLLPNALLLTVGVYHAYLALKYPSLSQPSSHLPTSTSRLCPNAQNLNSALFTWSWNSILCLAAILTAAPTRLLAFKQLGLNFTFALAAPKKLYTGGMYKYVQHPSYTCIVILVTSSVFLFLRPDGVLGCWLSREVVGSEWWAVGLVSAVWAAVGGMVVRVRDEERMLKKEFGGEWEKWHAGTRRFIPGVL